MANPSSGSDQLLDLLTALIAGPFETSPWSSFLERLRLATAADHSILVIRPPGRRMDDGLLLFAGEGQTADIAELYRKCFYPDDPGRYGALDTGKAYSLKDIHRSVHGQRSEAYWGLVEWAGIVGSRQIRVVEPNGVEAWLVIARKFQEFRAKDTALLAKLAAPLEGVIRTHVIAERGRFRSMMAAEAVRRLQCGWLLLDQRGHILASDSFGDAILESSDVIYRSGSGRLSVRSAKLEREILQDIVKLAQGELARARAISLGGDPWLDMLLVPAREKMISETAVPAVIAYVHGDNWRSADRCAQLSDMFDLSASEARLALSLCRGRSIVEAAAELGFTLETARSYSKSIYAKTGTRGMADLVRIIMGSVLTLAPDS